MTPTEQLSNSSMLQCSSLPFRAGGVEDAGFCTAEGNSCSAREKSQARSSTSRIKFSSPAGKVTLDTGLGEEKRLPRSLLWRTQSHRNLKRANLVAGVIHDSKP